MGRRLADPTVLETLGVNFRRAAGPPGPAPPCEKTNFCHQNWCRLPHIWEVLALISADFCSSVASYFVTFSKFTPLIWDASYFITFWYKTQIKGGKFENVTKYDATLIHKSVLIKLRRQYVSEILNVGSASDSIMYSHYTLCQPPTQRSVSPILTSKFDKRNVRVCFGWSWTDLDVR